MNRPTAIDITGQRFGRLVAVQRAGTDKFGEMMWLCKCDCGDTPSVRSSALRKGLTTSCGCWRRENTGQRYRTHGRSTSPEYASYRAMLRRCYDSTHRAWPWYGGRGIQVCDQWLNSFETFLAALGPRPAGWTLDRIENDKDYGPDNCRWAPWTIQGKNKRKRLPPLPLLSVSQ